MDQDPKVILEEYAQVLSGIKELEARRDEMKEAVTALIPKDTVVETDLAKFTLVEKTAWKYSQETTAAEAALKEQKKEEEMTGVAEAVPGTAYVMCKLKKSE